MPRAIFLIAFLCAVAPIAAQDSTRQVKVYDRTLVIPALLQQHTDSSGSGYITDGIDTLYYNQHMAIVPMYIEMKEKDCNEGDRSCAEENDRIRKYNDSLRILDPRIGKYHDTRTHGDGAWFSSLYPVSGNEGSFSLEIVGESQRVSFLLWTTTIDVQRQAMWRNVLESIN